MPYLKNQGDVPGSKFGQNLSPKPKKDVSLGEMKRSFMQTSDSTRSLGSHTMTWKEKRRLDKDLLHGYGERISIKEIDEKLKKLKKTKNFMQYNLKDRYEKTKVQDQIDFLEKAKKKLF